MNFIVSTAHMANRLAKILSENEIEEDSPVLIGDDKIVFQCVEDYVMVHTKDKWEMQFDRAQWTRIKDIMATAPEQPASFGYIDGSWISLKLEL